MKTLRGTREVVEIRDRLSRLTANAPRQWGTMSAGEMVCHLRGAFQVALGEETLADAPPPMPPKLLKFIALRAPMHWPHAVPTVPGLERGKPLVATTDFTADLAQLLAIFEVFVATGQVHTRHPIFGDMSTGDWMRWGYLHTDHHLRQFGC